MCGPYSKESIKQSVHMFPASAIGKKPTISAKTHDLKNKIFLGALTKTGADGDDHLAFFFTWPNIIIIIFY